MTRFLLSSAAILTATAAVAQDDELLVFDYSGFEDPSFHQPYVDQHGASPEFSFFGDEEEAFQKVVSGFEADVTHVCAGSVSKWIEADLVEPWDTSQIENFDSLNKDLTGEDVTQGDEVFFIPTDYGSTAIAYNQDEVDDGTIASLDVFQNPDLAGRLTIPDNVDDAYALAYLATGTTNWVDATDEQFQAATEWLRQVHPNLRTYWVDPAELSQLMSSGEILVAWAWNETKPTLAEQDFPIGFEREPEEGSSLWLCGYVNMRNSPGVEDKAYDYVNAVISQASAEPLLEQGFGSSNAEAMDEIGQEALVEAGLADIDAPVLAQLPISQELREKHSSTFERIKSGF